MKPWWRDAIAKTPLLLLVAASLLAGCVSGSKIRADVEVAKRDIAKARNEQNAIRCAPRDLAMAETHAAFTETELDQGNWLRADEHVKIAIAAAERAVENSRHCRPKKVLVKKPPKVAVIKKADTDGDGIFDVDDECPTDAEDKDGFEDEDGCPDFDNDQDGIPDYPQPEDKCPNEPGPPETKGCPAQDRDGDGIFDHKDECPDDPEDKDGFEDEDGCPDADNDQDGIPDYPEQEDKCPNEAGPPDSPQGKGCPRKYKLVKINREQKRIEIKQKVHFRTAKWSILPKSYKLLEDVAQVLKDFPKMKVSIEGHTDSRGGDRYNQRLSEKRANSVREHLVERHDIDPDRLQSIGYGETKPIASNRTARGREANRRVEFRIVSE